MSFVVAIPTYKRVEICFNQTISTLEREGISKEKIFVFVVEEEYGIYREKFGEDYQIIIGEVGLLNQRNFITNYFPEGQQILCLDDDIKELDLCGKSLTSFLEEAFEECVKQQSYIFSIYPVWNKFYREKQSYMTTCLNMCVGAFHGIINRKSEDLILKSPVAEKEDIERSILYFLKDKIVLRYNQYGFKTKYYNSVGGLGSLKERIPKSVVAVEYLLSTYPELGKLKVRKNGLNEFEMKKIKSGVVKEEDKIVSLLPTRVELFDKIYELLNQIKIPYKADGNKKNSNGRLGFPKYRGAVFGTVRGRYSGKIDLSAMSKKFPEIYEEIIRIGKEIVPFEFETIQLNHNLTCPKHKDKNNITPSVLVSFGEYTGGNIVVEGEIYDAKNTPIIFNGSLLEHWNTPDLEGNKYSLVFFKRNNN
jgi:hypothetical protein